MRVRRARREDAATIVGFQVKMALETEDLRLDENTVRCGVEAVFDHPHKGYYYVAESEETVVGSLLTVHEWSDWRNGTVIWIHSVYVRPEARRHGFYRKMYRYLQSLVNDSDELVGLRLYVDKRNQVLDLVGG